MQDQEEVAYACTAFATTGELFKGANAVKFAMSTSYHLVIIDII